METIFLFKALADVFMMLPLTLWTGDSNAFMATMFLYAISNGVEFYDLLFKEKVKSLVTVRICIIITVIISTLLAVISASCMMGYLSTDNESQSGKPIIVENEVENNFEYNLEYENSIKNDNNNSNTVEVVIKTPAQSLLSIPNINLKYILYMGIFPIIAHLAIAFGTYYTKKSKNFNNRYIN